MWTILTLSGLMLPLTLGSTGQLSAIGPTIAGPCQVNDRAQPPTLGPSESSAGSARFAATLSVFPPASGRDICYGKESATAYKAATADSLPPWLIASEPSCK